MFRGVLAVVLASVAVAQPLTSKTLTITFRQSGFYDGESSWSFVGLAGKQLKFGQD